MQIPIPELIAFLLLAIVLTFITCYFIFNHIEPMDEEENNEWALLDSIIDEWDRKIRWDLVYRSKFDDGQLAKAAGCYLFSDGMPQQLKISQWPWDEKNWEPTPNDRKAEVRKAIVFALTELYRLEYNIKENDGNALRGCLGD